MKKKRTLLLGTVLTFGLALCLQSCTENTIGNDNIDFTEISQSLESSSEADEACSSPGDDYFSAELGGTTFYIPGKNNATLVPEEVTPKLRIGQNPVVPNPTGWEYCESSTLKAVSSNTAEDSAPTISASSTNDSIVIIVKSNVDTSSSADAPVMVTYEDTADSDTLFVILSYSDEVSNSYFQFTVKSSKKYVQVYCLEDDPKTSRGTVTTVQDSPSSYGKEKNSITD